MGLLFQLSGSSHTDQLQKRENMLVPLFQVSKYSLYIHVFPWPISYYNMIYFNLVSDCAVYKLIESVFIVRKIKAWINFRLPFLKICFKSIYFGDQGLQFIFGFLYIASLLLLRSRCFSLFLRLIFFFFFFDGLPFDDFL